MRTSNRLAALLTPPPRRHDPAHERFCLARRDANQAFADWLLTRPDPDDVDDEVAGSISVWRQLVRLSRAGRI